MDSFSAVPGIKDRKGLRMDIRKEKYGLSRAQWGNLLENLAIVVLAFYPLRHIQLGLDLGDTGYNYANFQYMDHVDPMWLFSTYLTNGVGNLLTRLPGADTLMGMNLYTGLSASMLALMGYFFCTRKLRMPRAIAFLGEMLALSLCWCPTASFYNYMTYLFFLSSSIFLYLGLTTEKKRSLFWAGVFLGANVLVRFSNLAEMGMVLAVWAYDFIAYRSEKKEDAGAREGFWPRTVRHTLWCLAGYVAALAVLLGYIHIRYGIGEYAAGIGRLFAMTDKATKYKPTAMIMGILWRYIETMYWVVRIGIIMAGGMVMFMVAGWLEALAVRRGGASGESGGLVGFGRIIHVGVRVLWAAVCIAMIGWLYMRGFASLLFYSYDSIWHSGPLFLLLVMFIAAVRIFHRDSPVEEKLLGGMLILIILLTSIGSNNDIRPSLNNLFLAAPYALWESWRFLRYVGDKRVKGGLVLASFPAKGILTAILAICFFQFGGFGVKFAFCEGTGIQEASAVVENNAVLRNIKMSPQRARWMTEISAYVEENGLQGQEVILYGDIPSISYYLQMPSAFNPWSDLDSYSLQTMERDMAQLEAEITEKGREEPVIILEHTYALYEESLADGQGGTEDISREDGEGLSPEKRKEMEEDLKWKRLLAFMDAYGYEQTFRNGKFAVYR